MLTEKEVRKAMLGIAPPSDSSLGWLKSILLVVFAYKTFRKWK